MELAGPMIFLCVSLIIIGSIIVWTILTTMDEKAWLEVATCEDLKKRIDTREFIPKYDHVIDKLVAMECWSENKK